MSSKTKSTVMEDSEVFSIGNSPFDQSGASAEKGMASEGKVKQAKNKFRTDGKIAVHKLSVSMAFLCSAFILQLMLCLAVVIWICRVQGMELVFSLCFLLLNLLSAFCTFEVLLDRSKKLLVVSSYVSIAIFLVSMILLFILVSKTGEPLKNAEKLAAFTILIQFISVLAVMHCTYVMYIKENGQSANNLKMKSDSSARSAVKAKPVAPNSCATPKNVPALKTDTRDNTLSSKTGSERTRATTTSDKTTSAQGLVSPSTAPAFATAKEARQMRYFDGSSQSGNTSNCTVLSLKSDRN